METIKESKLNKLLNKLDKEEEDNIVVKENEKFVYRKEPKPIPADRIVTLMNKVTVKISDKGNGYGPTAWTMTQAQIENSQTFKNQNPLLEGQY
jgi:ribosome assembly protein YihI (activator of Der GTPase)